jgi:dTMP kinase
MELHQNRKIVCLEGIVGAGKTTQIERIYSHLSPDCYLIPELNEISPIKKIREELRKTGRISNMSKDDVINLAEARGQIHQKLLSKTDKPIILMDRGIYTGMVYESGPLSMWEVENISKKKGVVIPDICFILYCSAQKALERIDERRIKVGKYAHRAFHENEDYINETKEKYFEIAKYKPVILIDTSGTIDEIQDKIIGDINND